MIGTGLSLRRPAFMGPTLTLVLLAVGSRDASAQRPFALDTPNTAGVLRTITSDGSAIDTGNPFFQAIGANGRSCVTCHLAATGWTIAPEEVKRRFDRSRGLDPIF